MAKIYNVIQGPVHTDFYPDWDDAEGWVLLVLLESETGALLEEEIVCDTLAEAMEIVDWFKGQIAPFEMELED